MSLCVRKSVSTSRICYGIVPNFVVESDDYPTAQGFVAAGLGVTV